MKFSLEDSPVSIDEKTQVRSDTWKPEDIRLAQLGLIDDHLIDEVRHAQEI